MTTFSQAGQDIFVRRIFGHGHKGTFLDIGCAGDQFSNTLALEQEGWTGTLVDCDSNAARGRKSKFICEDATKIDFSFLPPYVDYLSLDVDEASYRALEKLPMDKTRFGVITIEHDAYRFGDNLRIPERNMLTTLGYVNVCQDVCATEGAPFEDWFCSEKLLASAKPFRFKGANKLYTEILGL